MADDSGSGRLAVAAIAGTLAIGGALLAVGPGAAAAPSGPPSREVRLVLVDQNVAVEADGNLRLAFRLAGDLSDLPVLIPEPAIEPTATEPTATGSSPPADPTPPTTVEPPPELNIVVVNYPPLQPGADLSSYVGSGVRAETLSRPIDGVVLDARTLSTVADDGKVTLDLAVSTDSGESVEERIKFDTPGLYPIVVSLVVGPLAEGTVVASYGTVVQRLPGPDDNEPSGPPIDLAIATAIGEIGPNPSNAELGAASAELDAVTALTAAIDSPVTLSIPPVVLAAAAARDPEALAAALVDDQLVSVPASPLDVSSAARAGIVDAFARQLREGEDLLTKALPSNVAGRSVWIATEPLSTVGAQVVRDLGYRYVIMSRAMYTATVGPNPPETDLFVDIALPDGGSLPLLVVDELGASLTTAATDEVLGETSAFVWAMRTIGSMLLDQQRGDRSLERSRVLATPDLSSPDPRLLIPLERLVRSTPNIRFAEAGSLTGVTDVRRVDGDPVRVRLPESAGPDITARLARLDAAAVAMLSAGSMLPDDDPRPAAWSSQISGLISTGYTETQIEADLGTLLAEADRLKSSVIPPEAFTFTLTGRAGDINLRVTNTADEPLRVLVRLTSPKLSFPDGERLVELRPNDQTMIAVPVRARTNGTSAVTVDILTPAGEQIHPPVVLGVRVNALTGFGQVLTGGLILVLLTWWFSHWRAKRRVAAALAGEVVARHPSNR